MCECEGGFDVSTSAPIKKVHDIPIVKPQRVPKELPVGVPVVPFTIPITVPERVRR